MKTMAVAYDKYKTGYRHEHLLDTYNWDIWKGLDGSLIKLISRSHVSLIMLPPWTDENFD